jgi:MerR family mercuric resistance operon transcriptional regulator
MSPPAEIAIGELSRRTQCNIETIRYYERIGLLPEPRRPGGRFRRYDANDIARLRFVRRARQLGFNLDGVRALKCSWKTLMAMTCGPMRGVLPLRTWRRSARK